MEKKYKRKMKYVCSWDKIKENTWSGIPYSIMNHFDKLYQIESVDTNTVLSRIFRKLHLNKFDLGAKNIVLQRKFNRKLKVHDSEIVFQFDDWLNVPNSYKYCDLTLAYLIDLYETDKDLFYKSNFRTTNISAMKRKAKLEYEYFKNNVNCIFTMSKWLEKYIIEKQGIPSSRVLAVGGGINIDKNKIDYSKKEGKRFLFIGRDFERKGGQLVVEAFNKLQKELKDIELYIIGPEKNLINKNNHNIFYIGDANYSTLPNYYNLCDVFVMPSYFEPLGLVFVEALTFGLPCIGRNVCEMPYLIENAKSGYLIDKDDVDLLAMRMKELLINSSYSDYVKSKKDFYTNEYSWETVCNKMNEIINRDMR